MQKHYCNYPENFTREARYILLYEADKLSYNQNLKGMYPDPESYIAKFNIQSTDDFVRNFALKTENKNDYFDVNIAFRYFDLTFDNRKELYALHQRKRYVAVLVSNTEMMVFGNDREQLTFTVADNIDDNGKGSDHFLLTLSGQTTVFPMLRKVSDPFRVLFFAFPFG